MDAMEIADGGTVDVKKEFGAIIKNRRIHLGLSQEALAERAGLHRTYVTDVERGTRNLSLESISKLARAFGISISALFSPVSSSAIGSLLDFNEVVDILLIEDDPRDVELTIEVFRRVKVANHINVVRDGAAALDLLLGPSSPAMRRPGNNLPHLILLDLNLPKISGMEVLRRLKADERTRSIHVIVLTVARKEEHMREAVQLGADGYITKPVDFQTFSRVTPQFDLYWTLLKPGSGPARPFAAPARPPMRNVPPR